MIYKLYQYLSQNFTDNETINRIILKNNMAQLFESYFKLTDRRLYGVTKMLNMVQTKRNALILNEIRIFEEKCNEYDLHPIYLKGIFLAMDIYDSNLEQRKSSDIDILIDVCEIVKYNTVLQDLGYYLFDRYDLGSFEKCVDLLSKMHIEYNKCVNNIDIHMELHASPICPPTIFKIETKDFIKNTVIKKYDGIIINTLSNEYNIIYLFLHFIKHLPITFLHNYILNKEEVYNNMSNVHDIVLFVKKYENSINWHKLVDLIKDMKVSKYILMVCNIINEIYCQVFLPEFINNLQNNNAESFMSTEDADYYGYGKFLWLFSEYFDQIFNLSAKEMLNGELSAEFNLKEIATKNSKYQPIIISNKPYVITKSIVSSIKDKNGSYPSAEFTVEFSKSGLSLFLRTNNKKCYFYEGEGGYYLKDGFELLIINEKSILHRMYTLSKKEEDIYVTISSLNKDNDEIVRLNQKENGIDCSFESQENSYTFNLFIEWKVLDIDTSSNDFYPLNISALIANPPEVEYSDQCNIFNDDRIIWDFRDIGYINFDIK